MKYLFSKFNLLGITVLLLTMIGSSAMAASTTITSLPYEANQSGVNFSETLYVAGTNLSSATDGIRFSGHDIVLNLGGDTLTFGTAGNGSNWGIRFWGDGQYGGYNIKIIGGTILHEPSDTTATYNNCVYFAGGNNIYFENTNFIIKGYNSHLLERPSSGWPIKNVEFNGGRWRSDVTGFSSRCQYDGAGARLFNALQPVSGSDYHFKIHDIVMESCPGQGLILEGKTFLYNCSLTIDARNDFYTYPSGGVCNSSANSFAIITQILQPGSKIYGNTIRAGTQYSGCDGGILLQLSKGSAADPVEIYENDIELHRGHDAYYWNLNVKAFKSRYANKHVWIHNNRFAAIVGNTSESSYGVNGTTVDVVSYSDAGSDWAAGRYPDSFLVYENNRIEAIAVGNDFEDLRCARFALEDNNGYTWEGAGNVWRNNHIITSHIGYQIGGYDNNGECHQLLIEGDTVEFSNNSYAGFTQYSYFLGFNSSSLNNYVRDMVYLNGADDKSFDYINNAGEKTVFLQRTLKVFIKGNNDLPIVNAACSVWNNYNDLVFAGYSDSGGMVAGVADYWKEAEDAPDISYNNFSIKAVFNSDQANNPSFTVGWIPAEGTDTLTLSNTTGTGEWGAGGEIPDETDTIPPAEVDDLGVSPGTIDGSVTLTWTAPGDDGNVGTAADYSLRFALDTITDYNWYLAEDYPYIPNPSSGGSPQSFQVSNLTPGQIYYFGLITTDEAANSSGVVSASGYARGILTPLLAAENLQVDAAAGEATLFSNVVNSYLNIVYEFQLATSADFLDAVSMNATGISSNYANVTFTGLSTSINYFYRVKAIADDQSIESNWSVYSEFNLVSGSINQPPSTPIASSPISGDTVTALTPSLTVLNSSDPDGDVLTYDFEIYDLPAANLIGSMVNVTESNAQTHWQIPDGLLNDIAGYSWRARAFDGTLFSSWSSFSSFYISTLGSGFSDTPEVIAFPNPVSFLQGQQATFTLPNDPSDLLIQTVAGETVILKTGLSGYWAWDGKNAYGIDVAMGIYLWYVNGSDFKGKIMVTP